MVFEKIANGKRRPMGNKLNVQFNDRQNKTLEEMSQEMGTTKAGVLKTALALLEVAIRERKDGNALGVVKGDKVGHRVRIHENDSIER
jgi:hypothetical protein